MMIRRSFGLFNEERDKCLVLNTAAFVVHILFNDHAGVLCHLAPPSLIKMTFKTSDIFIPIDLFEIFQIYVGSCKL